MKVVFDTNILVAASRSNRGAAYALVSMLPSSIFTLSVSLPLYMEYLTVLMRPDVKPYNLADQIVQDFIDEILKHAQTQNIYFLWRPWLKDEKDDMILELDVASQAAYIVTFNRRDFENIEVFGVEVITPSNFLHLVRKL